MRLPPTGDPKKIEGYGSHVHLLKQGLKKYTLMSTQT